MSTKRSSRMALLVALLGLALVPALSSAGKNGGKKGNAGAQPVENTSYAYCEKKGSKCPMRFNTDGKGKVVDFALYTKCAPVGNVLTEKFKVNRKGKFEIDTTYRDLFGRKVDLLVKGRFVNKGETAKGTYKVEEAGRFGCNDKTRKFKAKLTESMG